MRVFLRANGISRPGLKWFVFCGVVARSLAATWTWNGTGSNDNWSTPANWAPSGPPSSTYTTTVIFDGAQRLVPQQDIDDAFQFGKLVFTNTAGAFVVGGTDFFSGSMGWRGFQFAGSTPALSVLGTNAILVSGAFRAKDGSGPSPATSMVFVASCGSLQVPWFNGNVGDRVVKNGPGLLRVYEHDENQYYLDAAVTDNSAPEWRVNDGVVEIGSRTNRHAKNKSGTAWTNGAQVKIDGSVVVGDGIGTSTSAVLRLIGEPATVIGNGTSITVYPDGLLDFGNVQGFGGEDGSCVVITNDSGCIRMGTNALVLRKGALLDLHGGARFEGATSNSLTLYDGCTVHADATGTRAVLASDVRMASAITTTGVVFQVDDKPGDDVDLQITGQFGFGGAGLIKRGAGTLAISNYFFTTRDNRIDEGALQVNGVACGSGAAWLVTTNGTLGGCGVLSSAVVNVQSGTLNPGASGVAGVLTVESNVCFDAGSKLVMDVINGGALGLTHDQLTIQRGVLGGLTNIDMLVCVAGGWGRGATTLRVIDGGGDYTGQRLHSCALQGAPQCRATPVYGNGFVDVRIFSPITVLVFE
jgi:hypothetical protein